MRARLYRAGTPRTAGKRTQGACRQEPSFSLKTQGHAPRRRVTLANEAEGTAVAEDYDLPGRNAVGTARQGSGKNAPDRSTDRPRAHRAPMPPQTSSPGCLEQPLNAAACCPSSYRSDEETALMAGCEGVTENVQARSTVVQLFFVGQESPPVLGGMLEHDRLWRNFENRLRFAGDRLLPRRFSLLPERGNSLARFL